MLVGIDSRIVRKKIMQHILVYLEKEQKLADSWHLRARSVRAKPATLYLIYDPADVRLAQTFKTDLGKKGFQVQYIISSFKENTKLFQTS